MNNEFVLCIESPAVFNEVINDPSKLLKTYMVPRNICDKETSTLHQLVPCMSFFRLNSEEGTTDLVNYVHPILEESEDLPENNVSDVKASGRTSICFTRHITLEEDIVFEKKTESDHLPLDTEEFQTSNEQPEEKEIIQVTSYELSMEQLLETIKNVARREVKDKLNLDIEEDLNAEVGLHNTMVFKGKELNPVNKLHMALSVLVTLSDENFKKIIEESETSEDQIAKVSSIGIRYGTMLSNFNVESSIANVVEELKKERGLDDWSQVVLETLVKGVCQSLINLFDYPTIKKVADVRSEQIKDTVEQRVSELKAQETTGPTE